MNSEAADSIPHEYIDAEIVVSGLEGPADEQKLSEALRKLEGVRDFTITGGKLELEYEPVVVTKAEIGEQIARAGFRVGEVETGQASTIADALHGDE